MLLSRNEFREGVCSRDKNLCVICQDQGQDAHHILERRLWADGGYYLDNGATLCGSCHILAEQTILSCEDIRKAANIKNIIIPAHLYPDEQYDKWGNSILLNGTRMRGELFYDESVQKILAPVLNKFTKYIKYPRTWHLPKSPGATKDDRILSSHSIFEDKEVIVTVKMDGENTTFYNDYMHARSLDSHNDATRHWVLNYHSQIAWQIPDDWRICGENLFAKHSIHYKKLPSYFMMFSIWDQSNYCLSWDETAEWASLINISLVPVFYSGIWDEKYIYNLIQKHYNGNEMEGLVVRLADQFHYRDFANSVGKYVRAGHVQTSHSWRREAIIRNELDTLNSYP